MVDVFISYSQQDADLAAGLVRDLEALGFTTWWDRQLLPGDKFLKVIQQKLDEAQAVIVIWTNNSVNSQWVQSEAQKAYSQEKLITVRDVNLNINLIPLPFNIQHATYITERAVIFSALARLKVSASAKDKLLEDSLSRNNSKDALDVSMHFARYLASGKVPSDERITPRFNIIHAKIRYIIDENANTKSEAEFHIECVEKPAHIFHCFIRPDEESGRVDYISDIKFRAFDENGKNLEWLPTKNDPASKALVVFFPEVYPGQRKTLNVSYEWPRFFGKIIDAGYATFDWYYLTRDPEKLASLKKEWIFDARFSPMQCHIIGRASHTAVLHQEERGSKFAWVYEDRFAHLGEKRAVEFISS